MVTETHTVEKTTNNLNGLKKPTIAMINHGPDSEIKVNANELELPTDPTELVLAEEEMNLAIVKELRASKEWEEVVAYGHLSEGAREQSLTATSLRAAGLIHRRPLKFYNHDKTECILIAHLGSNLCGHQGIVHGGLLATLLDEHLAYVTIPHLPNSGFTANLNINYRAPVLANQWVVITGKLDNVSGRKAYADASIQHIETRVKMTEATALYISPKAPITSGK
ncbi:unnamed protein product [Cunninghamella blakesleeana]